MFQALKKLWLKDSRGLIVKNRSKVPQHPFQIHVQPFDDVSDIIPRMLKLLNVDNFQGGITEHKAQFAHEHAEIDELGDCVKALK